MTVTVTAIHGEQSHNGDEFDSNKDTSKNVYVVTGTTDIYTARAAAVAAIPSATEDGLIRNSVVVDHISAEHWKATATYVVPEKEKKDPDIGELEFDFDTTGGTQHLTSSKRTTHIFKLPGFDTVQFQNAIGCKKTKHGFDVAGVDVIVPKLEFTITTSFAPNVITLDWIKKIARLTGRTNDAEWLTFPKGELLFAGARIKAKYREKTTVVFSFSASENITPADNVTIGDNVPGLGQAGLGPIEKLGHEYMWVYYVQEDVEQRVLLKPWQVMIEQLYDDADFTELGLGG